MSVPVRVFPAAPEFERLLAGQPGIELVRAAVAADVVLAGSVAEAWDDAAVVLLVDHAAPGLLEEALAAGVADVVVLPQPPERIAFAVRKAALAAARERAAASPHRAQVITVFSPKGGTGKTVISSNLAASFAQDSGLRTLLVDLDLQFGDAAIMLGLDPEQTLHELASQPGELDDGKLQAYLTAHTRTGMDVLAAPLRPEDGELVSEETVDRVMQVARSAYDVIVVDTSPSFHGPMLSALDHSDTLLLVCNPEIPTLKNVRLGIETLRRLSYPEERMKLVLNRADPGAGLRRPEVEAALGLEVTFQLPKTHEVPEAVNRGTPLAIMSPLLGFSRGIRGMARALHEDAGDPGEHEPAEQRGRIGGAVRGLTTGWIPRRAARTTA